MLLLHDKLLPVSTGPLSTNTITTTTVTSGGVKLRLKSGRVILAIEVRALPSLAGVGSLSCLLAARCWASRNSPGGKEEDGDVLLLQIAGGEVLGLAGVRYHLPGPPEGAEQEGFDYLGTWARGEAPEQQVGKELVAGEKAMSPAKGCAAGR